jgi:hypothetical protein
MEFIVFIVLFAAAVLFASFTTRRVQLAALSVLSKLVGALLATAVTTNICLHMIGNH